MKLLWPSMLVLAFTLSLAFTLEAAHAASTQSSYGLIRVYVVGSGAEVSWREETYVIAAVSTSGPCVVYVNAVPKQVYVANVPQMLFWQETAAPAEWPGNESTVYFASLPNAGVYEVFFGEVVHAEPPTGLWQYLAAGNLLGFAFGAWTLLMQQIFWVVPYIAIFAGLFIKTESIEYCAIVFILLSSFLLVFMPGEVDMVAWVFIAIGVGMILYKLISRFIHFT